MTQHVPRGAPFKSVRFGSYDGPPDTQSAAVADVHNILLSWSKGAYLLSKNIGKQMDFADGRNSVFFWPCKFPRTQSTSFLSKLSGLLSSAAPLFAQHRPS